MPEEGLPMLRINVCTECKTPMSSDLPGTLCPACLLEGVLASDANFLGIGPTRADHESDCPLLRRVELGFADDPPSTEADSSPCDETGEYDPHDPTEPLETDPWWPLAGRDALPEVQGYEVFWLLGRGGMGVVYQAVQLGANRPVALKVIRGGAHVQPDQLRRLRVEGQSAARLRHPNVVQVYDVGDSNGLPYLALELLEGGNLRDRLVSEVMTARRAAELLVVLARAVGAAHRAGIVHRDLKPSNVLFDADGTPKVADFGLAKLLEVDASQTVSGQVLGSPSYMAPEQARGENRKVGFPADVHALGAILYEMLTGFPPYKGSTPTETLRMVIEQDPVRPRRFRPNTPRDLEVICLKCLEKDPRRRYATAGELAEDLERYLSGATIQARPAPVWEQVVKWSRRRPALATFALAVLAVLASLGVWGVEALQTARRRELRLARLWEDAPIVLDRARRSREAGRLDEARKILDELAKRLERENRVADLRKLVNDEQDCVGRAADEAADRERNRDRLARFRSLRDRALLLDGYAAMSPEMLFRDAGTPVEPVPGGGEGNAVPDAMGKPTLRPGLASDTRLVRGIALEALEVFGERRGDRVEVAAKLPASLTAAEKEEVRANQYLLLMVLAEAVARPLEGESAGAQAATALEVLEGARAIRSPTAGFHHRRAACLDRLGKTDAGRREREEEARQAARPADAFDLILRGQERARAGDWNGAKAEFEAARALRDDLFWAHFLLAVSLLNCDPPRPELARVALTTCVWRQPSHPWLYLLRGFANGEQGWVLAAGSRLAANGGALAAESKARFEDAEADFRRALDLGLDDHLQYVLLLNRGAMRVKRKQISEGAADFERAITLDSTRYNAYASLAHALRLLDKPDEAIRQVEEAIGRAPRLAALYRMRALTRLDRPGQSAAEMEEVLSDLGESARLSASYPMIAAGDNARRARLLLSLGRAMDALAAADAALSDAPGMADAHLVKTAALLELRRYRDSLASCDAALAHGRPSAALYRLRGRGRLAQKDASGAVEDFTRALSLLPEGSLAVRCERGRAYLMAGAPDLALGDFEAAVRLSPSAPEGYAGRAQARVRKGQLREGVGDVERTLELAGASNKFDFDAALTYAEAAARAAAAAARRGRPASRDSLEFEARASTLLQTYLEHLPVERRNAVWNDVIVPDARLAQVLHNPLVRRRLSALVKPVE
jgi:tetratricopeptide (TPR) repeat protein